MADQQYKLPQPYVDTKSGNTYNRLGGVFLHTDFDSGIPIKDDEGQSLFRYRFNRDLIERSGLPMTSEGFLDLGNGHAIPLEWVIEFVEHNKDAGRYGVRFLVRNGPRDRFNPFAVGETMVLTDYQTGQPKLTKWGARQVHFKAPKAFSPQQGFEFGVGFEITLAENNQPKSDLSPRFSLSLTTRGEKPAVETYSTDDEDTSAPDGPDGVQVKPGHNFTNEVVSEVEKPKPPSPDDDVPF